MKGKALAWTPVFPAHKGAAKSGHILEASSKQWPKPMARDRPSVPEGESARIERGRAPLEAGAPGRAPQPGQQLKRGGWDRYVARGAQARLECLGTHGLHPAPSGSTFKCASGRALGEARLLPERPPRGLGGGGGGGAGTVWRARSRGVGGGEHTPPGEWLVQALSASAFPLSFQTGLVSGKNKITFPFMGR